MPCSSLRWRASLPQAVVLPEPWRPAIRITVGPGLANAKSRPDPPISCVSSSETILTTCWPGLSDPSTSAPSARSLTAAVNCLTTLKLTSASSSARRTWRIAWLTSSSVSLPRERTSPRAAWRRSERASNTPQRLVGTGRLRLLRGARPRARSPPGRGQRVEVVGALMAAPVDEEAGRAGDAACVRARNVLSDPICVVPAAQLIPEALFVEAELLGVVPQRSGGQVILVAQQPVVHLPEP